MKIALIVIDCLRYKRANLFNFPKFQLLNNVVSVSNWTMPSLSTMLTGLHPNQHNCCLFPLKGDNKVQFINSLKRDEYYPLSHPTLMDQYEHKCIVEIPVYSVIKPGLPSIHKKANQQQGIKEAYDHIGTDFLYYHAKGAHSPFVYTNTPPSPKGEKEECEGLAKHLEPFISKLIKVYDRIVIASDHGEEWYEDTGGIRHGMLFTKDTLHVPVWVYPDPLPDKLYDTRVVYNYLMKKPIYHQQLVLSMSPAYQRYNRYAISYLNKKKEIKTKEFETNEGWII